MRFYLNLCMISYILDFIITYRISKYRKHVNEKKEIVRATKNIFLPIHHLFALIVNFCIMFQSEEYFELLAIMADTKVLSKEEGSNE